MDLLADCVTHNMTIEDETVTIKKLSVGDQQDIAKTSDAFDAGILTIEKSVLRWSFAANGVPLAVSRENIMRIRADVILFLGTEIAKFNKPKKTVEKNG